MNIIQNILRACLGRATKTISSAKNPPKQY